MDYLDYLADAATDLLRRVDDVLVQAGAPEDHPIWSLLGRVQALPGDAARAIIALHPVELAESGRALRRLRSGYEEARAVLLEPPAWYGPAAEAYQQHRMSLAAALSSDEWGLAARLDATASYLDDVAGWAEASRKQLASVLVEVLGSAEAVVVVAADLFRDPATPSWLGEWAGLTARQTAREAPCPWSGSSTTPPMTPAVAPVSAGSPVRAAAEIGARVLDVVVDCLERGEALLRAATERLAAISAPQTSGGAPWSATTLRLEH